MATLIKRGRFYYAQFYDHARRPQRKQHSLHLVRRRPARRILTQLEELAAAGQWDPWSSVSPKQALLRANGKTNARGQIVLTPRTNRHSLLQGEVLHLLWKLIGGSGMRAPGYAVRAPEGTKVPDVIWISDERRAQIPPDAADSPVMPELCVEVAYAALVIDEKRQLYFEGGAEEVWIVTGEGDVRFYGPAGRLGASELVEGFPSKVEV